MTSKFILQGVTTDSHLDEVRDVFQLADIERVIISVAFLNERGFVLLSEYMKPIADKATIFAGIRNGITSGQGLLACIECGCTTFAVDTGSRSTIFHPKIYMARSATEARIVIGSANLTVGGLNNNIESGLKIVADMAMENDAKLVDDLTNKIDAIPGDFPQHVFQVNGKKEVLGLLEAGRVIDEKKAKPPSPSGSSGSRDLDKVPRIELNKKKLKLSQVSDLVGEELEEPTGTATAEAEAEAALSEGVQAEAIAAPPSKPATDELDLVWTSNPLTRRPLNIPTAANTNPTGSMYFTKGQNAGIDQRHYFREEVFKGLAWANDEAAGKEHLERAVAKFRIVIKDVNYGVFDLNLTHDSRTDSPTYEQNNSVTQLHWGKVKPMVARDDLLGRTMLLYRDTSQPDQFVLEIN